MKKSKYTISQEYEKGFFLLTNFVTRKHILLSQSSYNSYNADKNCLALKSAYPDIFDSLVVGGFLVQDDLDEYKECCKYFRKIREDKDFYHLIINPTLDCNLSCWYCYEQKVVNSKINNNIIRGTIRHIQERYSVLSFKRLKISFFGGEPFMMVNAIKEISSEVQAFCSRNDIELILDFTTNGTLISISTLKWLSNFRCSFQITLDGDCEQHNKIKYTINKRVDTYNLTLTHIKQILQYIPNSFIAIRINYDAHTLENFNEVISDLKFIDKSRCKVILKKVWQVSSKCVNEELLLSVKAKLWKEGFIVDTYGDSGVCFADRKSQAVINYDGNIFKCTTISKFDDSTALGYLDSASGRIIWHENRIKYLKKPQILESCKKCILFPECGGPCKIRIHVEPNWECPNLAPSFDIYAHARNLFMNELTNSTL